MNALTKDRTLCSTTLALIALLLAMTWGFPGIGKFLSGGVPGWFSEQFGRTFLASFPGLAASYYSIAILETLAAMAALISLLRAEFIRVERPAFLYLAITLSLLLFVQLNLGKQLLMDFAGVHDLYMYFAATLVMLAVVRWMDPSRREAARTSA